MKALNSSTGDTRFNLLTVGPWWFKANAASVRWNGMSFVNRLFHLHICT